MTATTAFAASQSSDVGTGRRVLRRHCTSAGRSELASPLVARRYSGLGSAEARNVAEEQARWRRPLEDECDSPRGGESARCATVAAPVRREGCRESTAWQDPRTFALRCS